MASMNSTNSPELKRDGRPGNNVEDVSIIWFDPCMDELKNQEDVEKTKTILRKINDYVLFFSKYELFINHIKFAVKQKIFLIIPGSYACQYLDEIHLLKQIDSIFIFCMCLAKYLLLKEKYSKIIDIFTEHEDLYKSLTTNVESITKQAAVFSLFDGKEHVTRDLKRESASFLWFQLLTDVLKAISMTDTNKTGIEEMLTHCELYYRGNRPELNNIEEFRQTYKLEDAIRWYSKNSFVYRLVNKALRTEDIDVLYTFRVYITHLRNQIAHEYDCFRRTLRNTKSNEIHLYRGLKITNDELIQMRDNIGSFISMNGFLSTSRNRKQAMEFAAKKSRRDNVIEILIEINGNLNKHKMIFADIAKISEYPEQEEVLFDLASVFKIVSVNFNEDEKLWIMKLSGVEKSFHSVSEYIKSEAKEVKVTNPTILFGRLMCDMSEYEKSERYFKRLLKTLPENHRDISHINFYLGCVYRLHGEYKSALEYYERALNMQRNEIKPKEQSFDIAETLHNIGDIYFSQQQTSKALEYFEKALTMKRSLSIDNNFDNPSIATTLTAIGSVRKRQGNLPVALKLYEESYGIRKLSLPSDHPSIADSLDTLGTIYEAMIDYDQALDCYEKSLKIKQKTLPSKHPSICETLNNMGIIYRKQDEYDKALKCHIQALEIGQEKLSSRHPSICETLNNIGIVYRKQGDYDKSLKYHTQALEIEQETLSLDNLDLADTYNNLYVLYQTKALEMAQFKLKILKKHFNDDNVQIIRTKKIINELIEEINHTSNVKQDKDYSPVVQL